MLRNFQCSVNKVCRFPLGWNRTISVSRIPITIEILNKGLVDCEFVRHLSPFSTNTLLMNLPIEDRVHRIGKTIVYLETGLSIGAEKQRKRFKRGDMAYMTSNGSVCVFIEDSPATAPMNPIGVVRANLQLLESTRLGDVITMKRTS